MGTKNNHKKHALKKTQFYKNLPGSNGLIAVLLSLFARLVLIIPAPASPKPTRNKPVIFSMVVSNKCISCSPRSRSIKQIRISFTIQNRVWQYNPRVYACRLQNPFNDDRNKNIQDK